MVLEQFEVSEYHSELHTDAQSTQKTKFVALLVESFSAGGQP